jgi:hypothetical protein
MSGHECTGAQRARIRENEVEDLPTDTREYGEVTKYTSADSDAAHSSTYDAEDTATGLHAHSFYASMGTSCSDSEGNVLQRRTVTWVVH